MYTHTYHHHLLPYSPLLKNTCFRQVVLDKWFRLVHVYICLYRLCICISIYLSIYIYIYTHICTYTYTYMHIHNITYSHGFIFRRGSSPKCQEMLDRRMRVKKNAGHLREVKEINRTEENPRRQMKLRHGQTGP